MACIRDFVALVSHHLLYLQSLHRRGPSKAGKAAQRGERPPLPKSCLSILCVFPPTVRPGQGHALPSLPGVSIIPTIYSQTLLNPLQHSFLTTCSETFLTFDVYRRPSVSITTHASVPCRCPRTMENVTGTLHSLAPPSPSSLCSGELKRFSPRRNPDPIPNPHLHPQSSSPLYFIRFNKSPSDKTSPSFPSVPPSFSPSSSSSTFQKAGRVMAEAELAPLDTQEEEGGNRQGENKDEVRRKDKKD